MLAAYLWSRWGWWPHALVLQVGPIDNETAPLHNELISRENESHRGAPALILKANHARAFCKRHGFRRACMFLRTIVARVAVIEHVVVVARKQAAADQVNLTLTLGLHQ